MLLKPWELFEITNDILKSTIGCHSVTPPKLPAEGSSEKDGLHFFCLMVHVFLQA